MLQKITLYLLALLFVAGAYAHFANPAMSDGFIPEFLPKQGVHIFTGIVELVLGIGLLFPKTRIMAAWGIIGILSFFLILHIQDVFRDKPVIGNTTAALIRIPFQFLFMYFAWLQTKSSNS